MHDDYRRGDLHRDPKRKGWVYLGYADARGRPQWYRPPRFRRPMLFVLVMLAIGVVRAIWAVLSSLH